jgi:NAD(P)-dependent dehydrogenase (short-subunit alcohol dehydrogenase family)
MDFEGKNILIIGGSSGIGLNLVKSLTSAGANVYVASRTKSVDIPSEANHLHLDVRNDLSALVPFIPQILHGFVYAVGNINLKPISRITKEDLLTDFQLNVVGAVLATQQILPALKMADGASVVFISSVAAQTGLGFHSSVAAAKGGLEGAAIALAAELAPIKIRVNVVAPSLTDTPLAERLLNTPEKREAANKRHPLGRFGSVDDITAAISYFLSEGSSWVSGQILRVDGGMSRLRTNI